MSAFAPAADPETFRKARENVLYGKAPIEKLDVNEPNSILNRLVELVRFLAAKHPKEGWDEYLDGDASLLWGKLVLAGQSQGGGHASLLAMRHEVARVLMFGSPKDFSVHFGKPAAWYSGPEPRPSTASSASCIAPTRAWACTYPAVGELSGPGAVAALPGDRRGRDAPAVSAQPAADEPSARQEPPRFRDREPGLLPGLDVYVDGRNRLVTPHRPTAACPGRRPPDRAVRRSCRGWSPASLTRSDRPTRTPGNTFSAPLTPIRLSSSARGRLLERFPGNAVLRACRRIRSARRASSVSNSRSPGVPDFLTYLARRLGATLQAAAIIPGAS